MPYCIWKNDKGEHCVYKEGSDKKPTGKSFGCHPTQAKAEAQMRAMYANSKGKDGMMGKSGSSKTEYQMVTGAFDLVISEFKGNYPDIPLPADIDRTVLGEDTIFVTLPVGFVGAKSRNGRNYPKAVMESVVKQINENRPEGSFGHMKDEDRPTVYHPPAIRWLVALMDNEGTVWAKGLPLTSEAKEHFRVAKATNAKVGTSLYGTLKGAVGADVQDIVLEKIDIADPTRVGIPDTAALVHITSEQTETEVDMTEERVQELTEERTKLLARIQELEDGAKLTTPKLAELVTLGEMLGDPDVSKAIKALKEQHDSLATENAALLITAIEAKVATIKPESARLVIKELVQAKNPLTRKDVDAVFTEVIGRESVKALIKEQVIDAMGPAQGKPNGKPDVDGEGWKKFVNIPEPEKESK